MGLSAANGLWVCVFSVPSFPSFSGPSQDADRQAEAAAPAESFRKFLLRRLMFLLSLFHKNNMDLFHFVWLKMREKIRE
jgi:hypothetical protein